MTASGAAIRQQLRKLAKAPAAAAIERLCCSVERHAIAEAEGRVVPRLTLLPPAVAAAAAAAVTAVPKTNRFQRVGLADGASGITVFVVLPTAKHGHCRGGARLIQVVNRTALRP